MTKGQVVWIGLTVLILIAVAVVLARGDVEYFQYFPVVHKAATEMDFHFVLTDFRFVSITDAYGGTITITSDTGVKFEYKVFDYYGRMLQEGVLDDGIGYIIWPHTTSYIGIYVTDGGGNQSIQVMRGQMGSWHMTDEYPSQIDDPPPCDLPIFGYTSITRYDHQGIYSITCHIPSGVDELYLNDVSLPPLVYSEWLVMPVLPATYIIRAVNDCGEVQTELRVGGEPTPQPTPQPTPTLVIP